MSVNQSISAIFKVGYFADGPWAHLAFDKLYKDPRIEICFICVRYDAKDETLLKKAELYNIDAFSHPRVNSEEFINMVSKYDADLFISMSFNQIFKRQFLNVPRLGIINCHAGKLPFYRGRNVLNWVLINDEKEFGITVHHVDEGIDTGDIVLQKSYEITDEDTYATLLQRAYFACSDLLYQAVCQIIQGTAKRIRQKEIDPVGMYCGMRGPGDEIIDWTQSSRDVFNFIRALTRPGPGTLSYINGQKIIIYGAKMIDGARPYKNIAGQILGKSPLGFYVKTGDTFLEITDYSYDGKIRIGDRLKWR